MKATIERVSAADVVTESDIISSIERGLCVQMGFHKDDTFEDIEYMVEKILNIRFFTGEKTKLRRNVVEAGLEIICVSEPSFFAVMRGNKTTFPNAMDEEKSEALYLEFLATLRHKYKGDRIKDCSLSDRKEVRAESDGSALSMVDTRA